MCSSAAARSLAASPSTLALRRAGAPDESLRENGRQAPPAKAPARPKSAPKLAHGGGGHAGAANHARGFGAEPPSCSDEPAGAADNSDVPTAARLRRQRVLGKE